MKRNICPICKTVVQTPQLAVPFDYSKPADPKDYQYKDCPVCHAVFCETMRDWSDDNYRTRIYNADYLKVDRDYDGARASFQFPRIAGFLKQENLHTVLDYGGGKGELTDLLRGAGFDAYCFDPFGRQDKLPAGGKPFDAVIAIEVLEHAFQAELIWDLISENLRAGGMFFSTTEFRDSKALPEWFYVNPRAGHVLLYSRAAFSYMAISHNMNYIGDLASDINFHLCRAYGENAQ